MTQKSSDTVNVQGGLNLDRYKLEPAIYEPAELYKTFKEFPQHEKLIRESSYNQIFEERPKTASVAKEEKAINTSKDEKKLSTSDKVNSLVNCPICLDMIENAMETPCCHNIFCEGCIVQTDTCPICTSHYLGRDLLPNIPMRRLINELVIKCYNEDCEVECTKANMDKHLESCMYSKVSCPNSDTCKTLLRKDLEIHLANECEHRIIDCILMCGTKLKINVLYDHIHRVCPKALIPCKNNCGEVVERGELMYHVNSKCKNEVIACMYKQTLIYQNGCDIKLKRCDMKDHLAQCPFRVTKCTNEGCTKKIAYKDRQKHDGECKYKEINCRNNCGATFERRFEDEHFEECELQLIRCPYYEMGCKSEILRKEYLTHLQSEAFSHSVQFIDGQNKKNEEIQSLKTELAKVVSNFNTKFDELFKALNVNKKVEEDRKEPTMEKRQPTYCPSVKVNNFKIYSNDSDDDQDLEDYQSDEFESDYSFGFKN